MTDQPTDGRGIDRRQVLKVGAWAAPAIVVAAAVPAAVASDYTGDVFTVSIPVIETRSADQISGYYYVTYDQTAWLSGGAAANPPSTLQFTVTTFLSRQNGTNVASTTPTAIFAGGAPGYRVDFTFTGPFAITDENYVVEGTAQAVAADDGTNTFTPDPAYLFAKTLPFPLE